MKIYKQAVLIPKDHGYLEVISYYDHFSKKFGLDFFLDDKLIESIATLDAEPTRDEMRFFGLKLTVKDKGSIGQLNPDMNNHAAQ
jgi:hypothetical protein